MAHPCPYFERERDYDPVTGRDIGPWDSAAGDTDDVAAAAIADALIDRRLLTVSVSLPVDADYEADALSRDGRPFGIQVTRPSGLSSMVTVLAAPAGQGAWGGLADAHIAAAHRDGATEAYALDGVFGREVWVEYADHDVLVHGVDGPRWVCKVTHWARDITAELVDEAEQLTAGIIIARGNAPVPPDTALDMRIIATSPDGETAERP